MRENEAVITLLKGVSENKLQERFQLWNHHFTKCVVSQVVYFENDSSQVSRFCFHKVIPGIKLSHLIYLE